MPEDPSHDQILADIAYTLSFISQRLPVMSCRKRMRASEILEAHSELLRELQFRPTERSDALHPTLLRL